MLTEEEIEEETEEEEETIGENICMMVGFNSDDNSLVNNLKQGEYMSNRAAREICLNNPECKMFTQVSVGGYTNKKAQFENGVFDDQFRTFFYSGSKMYKTQEPENGIDCYIRTDKDCIGDNITDPFIYNRIKYWRNKNSDIMKYNKGTDKWPSMYENDGSLKPTWRNSICRKKRDSNCYVKNEQTEFKDRDSNIWEVNNKYCCLDNVVIGDKNITKFEPKTKTDKCDKNIYSSENCNEECKSVNKDRIYYRPDLGGCVDNFCYRPTKEGCKNNSFKNRCDCKSNCDKCAPSGYRFWLKKK
tara:strand:+ start:273 stop:1175 length:903 start_codon:yes stop_codon:yes gene_type:complete